MSGRACGPPLPPAGVPEAKALALRLEDVAAVREAIEGGSRKPLAVAAACFLAAIGFWITDRLVVTDREYLDDLFPRLALAAEQQDAQTIIAAFDPELYPLRQEAEQVLKRVKPTRILITYLDVAVDAAKSPPEATADVVIRVAGNTIEAGSPGDILAEFRVLLHKKDGTWLIRNVEADRAHLIR